MPTPPEAARVDPAATPPAPVLLLGHPALRETCRPVDNFASPELGTNCAVLAATLERFRARNGFGRAIAAPQIGVPLRIVALNLGSGPFIMCNPTITARSAETFTLWDDCMSFPWVLVRVRRHRRVSIGFQDPGGAPHVWSDLDPAISELLQHELDHLDGILALDRAIDGQSIIAREVYEADRARHDAQVEYAIVPTIPGRHVQ